MSEKWGECVVCGMCSTIEHEWWCPRNPDKVPCPPKLGVGELDGDSLIEMNNVAVGFVRKP